MSSTVSLPDQPGCHAAVGLHILPIDRTKNATDQPNPIARFHSNRTILAENLERHTRCLWPVRPTSRRRSTYRTPSIRCRHAVPFLPTLSHFSNGVPPSNKSSPQLPLVRYDQLPFPFSALDTPTLRRHLRSRSEEDRLFRGLIDGQTLRNILCVERSPCVRNSLSKKQLPLHKNSWSLKSTLACGQTFKRYAHCVLWAILQLNQKIVHTVLCPISYGQTVKPCRQRHFLMAPHCSSLPVFLRLQLQM